MKAKRSRKIKTGTDKQMLGKVEVFTMEVPNPAWRSDLDKVPGFPKEIRAAVNMRESPVAWMLAHKHLDKAQVEAANEFRRCYETAGAADLKAMDTTKEPVDGGGFADVLTDRKMAATDKLHEAYDALGPAGYSIVRSVCGDCVWLKDLEPTKRRQWEAGKHLKECLDVLAIRWGYQMPRTRTWRKAG